MGLTRRALHAYSSKGPERRSPPQSSGGLYDGGRTESRKLVQAARQSTGLGELFQWFWSTSNRRVQNIEDATHRRPAAAGMPVTGVGDLGWNALRGPEWNALRDLE